MTRRGTDSEVNTKRPFLALVLLAPAAVIAILLPGCTSGVAGNCGADLGCSSGAADPASTDGLTLPTDSLTPSDSFAVDSSDAPDNSEIASGVDAPEVEQPTGPAQIALWTEETRVDLSAPGLLKFFVGDNGDVSDRAVRIGNLGGEPLSIQVTFKYSPPPGASDSEGPSLSMAAVTLGDAEIPTTAEIVDGIRETATQTFDIPPGQEAAIVLLRHLSYTDGFGRQGALWIESNTTLSWERVIVLTAVCWDC